MGVKTSSVSVTLSSLCQRFSFYFCIAPTWNHSSVSALTGVVNEFTEFSEFYKMHKLAIAVTLGSIV